MVVGKANKIVGLAFRQLEQERYHLVWCLVVKEGESLELLNHGQEEGTLQQVLVKVPKGHPVCLSFAGKGVLHRTTSLGQEQGIVATAFPGLEVPAFYSQVISGEQLQLVSICRKEIVDSLLEKLERAGLLVYLLSLGGLSLLRIQNLLRLSNEWSVDGYHFKTSPKHQLLSYHEENTDQVAKIFEIGAEKIEGHVLLPYSLTLQFALSAQVLPIAADVPILEERRDNLWANIETKKNLLRVLGAVFMVLLVNFLVFSYLNDQNAALITQVGVGDAGQEELDVLKQDVSEMEQLLESLHWNEGYNYGFLTHEIGQSLPRSLQLNDLAFNESPSADQVNVGFAPTIRVKGQTSNLIAVNNWLYVLKHKSWVKDVKLLRCQENKETAAFDFEMLVNY